MSNLVVIMCVMRCETESAAPWVAQQLNFDTSSSKAIAATLMTSLIARVDAGGVAHETRLFLRSGSP